MILTHPSGYDYQLWQQQFPVLQPSMNNLGYFSGIIPNDSTMGNSNLISSLSKHSQQSYREHDQRSLLGKYVFSSSLISPSKLPFIKESYEIIPM